MHLILVSFLSAVVVAFPPTEERWSSECRQAVENERCSRIIENGSSGEAWRGGLKSGFQHYCRKIADYVPCLEEDKDNYRLLTECQEGFLSGFMMGFEHILTWDETWNMTIDFLDTVNDIICTRTDEVVKLMECVKSNKTQLMPQIRMCMGEHLEALAERLGDDPETIEASMICKSISGFATCMKEGVISMCGAEFTDLLDTVYDDVIDGVIGDAFDCETSNPLLNLIRSVRNKYKK